MLPTVALARTIYRRSAELLAVLLLLLPEACLPACWLLSFCALLAPDSSHPKPCSNPFLCLAQLIPVAVAAANSRHSAATLPVAVLPAHSPVSLNFKLQENHHRGAGATWASAGFG